MFNIGETEFLVGLAVGVGLLLTGLVVVALMFIRFRALCRLRHASLIGQVNDLRGEVLRLREAIKGMKVPI